MSNITNMSKRVNGRNKHYRKAYIEGGIALFEV